MKIIIDISEHDKEWITNGYSIPQELNTEIAKKIIEAKQYFEDYGETWALTKEELSNDE